MADNSIPTLRRFYLSAYNWVVLFGWLQVLYYVVKTLRECGHERVYDAVERPLQWAQTAAVLEIIHLLLGPTRSPVLAAFPQISSRLYVIWGILWSFPETQTHWLVTPLMISWSIKEIIRHSFCGIKQALGFAPSWLLWLRYSSCIILHTASIISEVGIIYKALPFVKFLFLTFAVKSEKNLLRRTIPMPFFSFESEKYCIRMPNKWNFSFDYFYASIVILGSYAPGTLHTYSSLLLWKRKHLSKSKKE